MIAVPKNEYNSREDRCYDTSNNLSSSTPAGRPTLLPTYVHQNPYLRSAIRVEKADFGQLFEKCKMESFNLGVRPKVGRRAHDADKCLLTCILSFKDESSLWKRVAFL